MSCERAVMLVGREFVVTQNDDGTFSLPPELEALRGRNVALKPAHEPIIVARKPLIGTVVKNVLTHGTGVINIDGCRIGTDARINLPAANKPGGSSLNMSVVGMPTTATAAEGRWPANVVLAHSEGCRETGTKIVLGDNRSVGNGKRPGGFGAVGAETGDPEPNAAVYGDAEVTRFECVADCAVRLLDEQSGTLVSGRGAVLRASAAENNGNRSAAFGAETREEGTPCVEYADSGGASRFFYCAKASSSERNAGLDDKNSHPTVKPIALMRWLVRLVTPPDGVVLDPFCGSGSTGIAAVLEGFNFVGVDLDEDDKFCDIARKRIAHHEEEAS